MKKPRPSLVDRALARLGLARAPKDRGTAPRRGRAFAAAQQDRLTGDFFSGTTSPNGELKTDLRTLRNRSRTMARDSAIAKRYCALFPENVVGEKGIQLSPRPLVSPGGEIDQALKDTVLDAWRRWGLPEHCTVDGRLGFVELQQAMARLEPMDGEVLLRLVDGVGAFGFSVQLLDPDQLDETLNVEPNEGRPLIRQGVELDVFGRPVAYHIWDGHPRDTTRGVRKRIPAADIIHLFQPFRPGAARGIPWLHAALRPVNMLEGYAEATLVAARMSAAVMGSISGVNDDADEEVVDMPLELEPGKMMMLPDGATSQLLDPKHPTTSYSEFYKSIVRSIAQAGGVSYTSLSGDLEAVNYSSIRAGLLAERDYYRMLQQRLVRYALRRIYARWLPMAQLTGQLRITAVQVARAERIEWMPRGFPWVDPLKDIEALRAGIALGIDSRTDAAADRGRDYEATLEVIAEELKLADQYQVDVSGAAPVLPTEEPAVPTTPARGRMRIANG